MKRSQPAKRTLATVALVAGLALNVLLVDGAAASAACSPNSGVWHAGGITTTPVYYAAASITDRPINLCSGNYLYGSDASAWVMIGSSNAYDYAQIGFGKAGGTSSPSLFAEYNAARTRQHLRKYFSGYSAGRVHAYEVVYSFSTGKVYMNADGVTQFATPFAADTTWYPGWKGEFLAEVHNPGDDFPGTAAAPVTFSNNRVRTSRSGGIVTPTFTWFSSQLSFGRVSGNSSQFNLWTQR